MIEIIVGFNKLNRTLTNFPENIMPILMTVVFLTLIWWPASCWCSATVDLTKRPDLKQLLPINSVTFFLRQKDVFLKWFWVEATGILVTSFSRWIRNGNVRTSYKNVLHYHFSMCILKMWFDLWYGILCLPSIYFSYFL